MKIDGRQLENVRLYKYLGVLITEDGRDNKEMISRTMARLAFTNLEKFLRNNKIDLQTRKRLLCCYSGPYCCIQRKSGHKFRVRKKN